MITSAASITSVASITSMLAIGVTTGSAILSGFLIVTFATKEISLSFPEVDRRLVDSLNAALIPLVFAFAVIFVLQALSVIS